MSLPEKEDDTKKTSVRPEPLCLFCFPEETSSTENKTYINTLQKEPDIRGFTIKEENLKQIKKTGKEKEEFWLRKRTEARIRRRRMKEPIRNLKSFLLTSVKNEKVQLPSVFQVLEIVKDAWPSPSSRNINFQRNEVENQLQKSQKPIKVKNEQSNLHFSPQLLNRRFSMPEELMRKYSVSIEKTSEESETNKTTIDVSPSSSSTLETARRKDTERLETKEQELKSEVIKTDTFQQTRCSEDEKPRKTDLPKRVTQSDFYKQGKQIIKVKTVDKGTCICEKERESSTTASAKEETDESGTTESIPSSSPKQLPKRESSSDNLSSESDNVRCTCAELSSKETSTDLYLSGNSTLSQTVSDKSMSTQDSTVSINSVSTRGSTVSDNSNSTTPEVEKTSAKETTTSPDYSPRTPRNRKNRRRDKQLSCCHNHSKTCPKYNENKYSKAHLPMIYNKQCPVHSEKTPEQAKATTNASTNTDDSATHVIEATGTTQEVDNSQNKEKSEPLQPENQYKWAKLSQEELYMMQQLRHRKFVESQRKLSNPLPPTPDTDSITVCGTGSSYKETERIEQPILIPRYSALPRSISMLVNTSSPDTSHNSDSDNQSLADSLEDQPITHVHKLYFDTKKELKPVRGDASVVQDTKFKHRQPRGRAFFVSIKEPFGEDKMLENIEKIPQPPEKIKNQIFERHLNLCEKHKHLHEPIEQKVKGVEVGQKKRKTKLKNEEIEKNSKTKKKTQEESKNFDHKSSTEKGKRTENKKPKAGLSEDGVRKKKVTKDGRTRLGSKIPILVSSRSASSSPERDLEPKEKPERSKTRLRRDSENEAPKEREVETTQILEITHAGGDLSLQKPQAVIHPSQAPYEAKPEPHLTMPPLASTLKIPPGRQPWNKPLLLAPARRSPIGKFRQRFEVIPEEKSSSLSSAEEKTKALPKFSDASTSPLPSDKIQFHSYSVNEVPNLIVAKITNKHLETLPYVKGSDNQKIILFSSKPQNCNSSKGRDALIAMNREDFNRLAKGWMNFYKLSENMENSENEEEKPETNKPNDGSNKQCLSEPKNKQEETELGENIRFDCSNTILRAAKSMPASDSGRRLQKQNTFPEFQTKNQKTGEVEKSSPSGCLPKVLKTAEDDETDSDSTDYMEPPSPRVPPLPIDDIPSDATLSSSDSELNLELNPPNPATIQSLKYLQFNRRGPTNRTRLRKETPFETSRFGKKKDSGWSVTVAGTLELSRSAPDLEMRLSFPANGGPPFVSHSDSAFAEDSKLNEYFEDLDLLTSRKELALGEGNSKQKWTVTVKNPKQGEGQERAKQPSNTSNNLPDLEPRNRNLKKVLKDAQFEERMKHLVERKMIAIWPKVQNVLRNEFLTESGRLIPELEYRWDEECCLSVRGSAVSLERKQRPPKMTEKEVTRRCTSRSK